MKSFLTYIKESLNIFEKQNPFNVWIMVGLPGSGKSTYIKEELPKNIEIVNQDSIRVKLGIMKDDEHKAIGNSEQEKEVTKICLERIDKEIVNRRFEKEVEQKHRNEYQEDFIKRKLLKTQNYGKKEKCHKGGTVTENG